MNSRTLIALILVVAGIAGLAYGKFSYTKEKHQAKLGPLEFSVKDKETVNVPQWASIAAIVVGAGLLVTGRKR
jgi:uncharacterized membrane protein YidH (DUF202 family)